MTPPKKTNSKFVGGIEVIPRNRKEILDELFFYCALNGDHDIYDIKVVSLSKTFRYIHIHEGTMEEKILCIRILLLRFELTKEAAYHEMIISFIKQEGYELWASKIKDKATLNFDYKLILLFLYVYPVVQGDWVLSTIKKLTYRLLWSLFAFTENGLATTSIRNTILPPCGLLNGNSGIALIFIQLGKFFDNSVFYLIVDKLFNYENTVGRSSDGFWPELRHPINDFKDYQSLREKFASDRSIFPDNLSHSLNFDQGAIGIGFIRLHAFSHTLNTKYLKDVKQAIHTALLAKTKEDSWYCLLLLIKYHQVTGDFKFISEVKRIISFLKEKKFQFLTKSELLLLDQFQTDHQFPMVNVFHELETVNTSWDFNYDELLFNLLKHPFYHTLKVMEKLSLDIIRRFIQQYSENQFLQEDYFTAFYNFLKSSTDNSQEPGIGPLLEIARLENMKICLQQSIKNFIGLKIQEIGQILRREELLGLSNQDLLAKDLVMNENVHPITSKWHWIMDEIDLIFRNFDLTYNLEAEPSEHYGVIEISSQYNYRLRNFISDSNISEFEYILLDFFELPEKVSKVYENFLNLFDIQSTDDEENVKKNFFMMLRKAIFKKYLTRA